jgi:integrase
VGTVLTRRRKDGTPAYTGQVRIKRSGKIVHTEASTFDRKREALAWIKQREAALSVSSFSHEPTLADVIQRYISEMKRPMGKTKAQVLRTISQAPIASKQAPDITSADLVEWLQGLDMSPQTRGNYASHLSSVFAIARPAWGYDLKHEAMLSALKVARIMGLVGKSKRRERRPTLDELDSLMQHFNRVRRSDSNDMRAIVAFALFSTRRLGEICRMRWDDLDADTVMVRDMKDPRMKQGNDVRCALPPEALAIIRAMPVKGDRIFTCNEDAVSAAFTRACKVLGIQGLVFHSMRHEGTSRLFEMGMSIPQVAAVTGHKSWASLQRYTHIKQTGDKYADWPWLQVIASAGDR